MKMKISSIGVLLLSSVALGAKPPVDLQQRLEQWNQGQSGGVAVAWVDADGPAFFQTGQFDAADPRPITPDTQFELGSVTKVFTALLLADSERAGKVSRSDPAARYLLPADDAAQAELAKITLLSLATHTSGLPRLPANIGSDPDGASDPYASYDTAALIAGLRLHGPAADVGRKFAYSNFGVSVLGEALASAWGTSYAAALRDRVLAPLGMNATTLGLAGQTAPVELAPGHVGGQRVPNWTFLVCAPCGAARSSARDMAIFLEACLGRRETPLRATIDATLQPQREDEDSGSKIGLGWMLFGSAERPIVWHGGATAGSHAFVAFSPQTGAGVAILANSQKASEKLGFGLLGREPPKPRASGVENADDYPGRYPLSPAFAITITAVKGALFGQATGQPRFAMRPVSADRFSVVGVAAEVSFERDGDGKVVALVLHQNGRDQRGPRGELPPAPKEVVLPAGTLAEYPGSYPLAPTFVLTVTVENGAVFVQATGQEKFPVFATARDQFFYKIVEARISFERDDAGKVSGLVLHQNGRDMPAAKAN